MTCRALAAAALLSAVAACANHRDVALQPTASPASAYDVALRAKGAQLAAQDRAGTERRRAEIARVVSGSARDVTPPGATAERFVVQLANRGGRALRRIDGGVIVYGGRGLHRLGLATFSVSVDVPPGRRANVGVAIPRSAFGTEGAGALAAASGMPKRVELELTGYRVESGRDQRETD
ncbi:MAG TPA: hypothetical protein VGU66_20025 [Candidatus Elarobacter sp.]|nr:hypothetical protein [Candidatus Elarobacter sp.]